MGGWSTPRTGRFNPGITRYPLYSRLGELQCQSGRVRKISTSTGIRSPHRPARSESLYRLSYPVPDLGNITASCSRSPWFRSRAKDDVPCMIFFVKFLSPSKQIDVMLRHNSFLPLLPRLPPLPTPHHLLFTNFSLRHNLHTKSALHQSPL